MNITGMALPEKARRRFSLLCLLAAAVAVAFVFSGPLQAQEGAEYGYVDLIVTYEYDSEEIAYSIRNVGTAAATGVTVSFLLEDLQTDKFVTSSSITTTETGTNQSFTWEVGTLLPGDIPVSLKFSTRNHAGHSTAQRIGVITATASSNQPEPGLLLGNNVTKVYSYAASTTGASLHMEGNKLGLLLSVDDLRPAAGGDVSFGLTAISLNPQALSDYINLIDDIDIKVELSNGLEFKPTADWTRPIGFATSGQSATWKPDAVDSKPDPNIYATFPISRKITIQAQLTADTPDDIPREERCITSWVAGSTPTHSPDYVLGSLKQCLGDEPPVLFEQGQVDLFTLDATAQNNLELLAQANIREQMQVRSHGIGRVDEIDGTDLNVILSTNKVIVQVKDSPSTRGFVTDNSVSRMTWQTKGGNDVKSGVEVRENINGIVPLSDQGTASTVWTDGKDKLTATGIDGGSKPGTLRIFAADETFKLADADTSGFTNPAYDFAGSAGIVTGTVVLHFGGLGTYKMGRAYKGTHNTAGEKTTPEKTYLFHVGPVAELEVRDGGGNLDLPAGQRAYTVMAVNNGPDTAPAARVVIKGLPKDAKVDYTATRGNFNFDPKADEVDGAWVWAIGELITKDVSQTTRGRDGEVLTISAAADTAITATISNTQDYGVCIDSSANDVVLLPASETACEATNGNTWHTAEYYDYDDGNDTAVVSQVTGTGESRVSAMQVGSVQATSVSWGGLRTLYSRAVTHYEVERSTDGGNTWRRLSDRWPYTTYVDTGAGLSSSLHYRVRAVNHWGHKGPWSRFNAAELAGGDESPQPPGMLRAKLNSGGSITLTWDSVDFLLYGDPVSHYEVQRQRGAWETIANGVADTEYTDFGAGGRMSPYRVRAVNVKGREGPWSDVIDLVTAEQRGVLAAPTLSAHTTTEDTIRLTWTVPSNQRDAVTGYELQYLDGDEWVTLDDLGPEDTGYEDWQLPFGAVRTYRVRARADEEVGRWSNEVTAMTPPGRPYYLAAEPDGPNTISITWEPPLHDTHDTVQRYELEVSSTDVNSGYSRLASPSAAARSYTHSGLSPGSTRYYQLRACNSAGCGNLSFPAEATTSPAGVPSAPGLTASTTGQWQEWSEWGITLSWSRPNEGASPITAYQLDHSIDGSDWEFLGWQIPPDVTEYVHQEYFNPGETHRYRVRALNELGESAWSAVRSVTIPARPPFFPELSFGESTDSTITLDWTVPEANGSLITGYRVQRNDPPSSDDTTWKTIANVGASPTTYTDGNLWQGEYYCYRVAANSNMGLGEYSYGECERTTGPSAGPPDPPILRLSSVSPTAVTVAWDPPQDDGGRPVTNYVYEMSPFDWNCGYALWDKDLWPPNKCHLVSSGTRSASFSGLTPGRAYQFRVRTETSYGNGEWAVATALLPAARDNSDTTDVTEDLQLRLSTTSLTVNEGGEASYTVRLNKAPQEGETVQLTLSQYGGSESDIFLYNESTCFWLDFNRENWSSGCTLTLSPGEDRNSDNEIYTVEHSITIGGWEVSGPGVRVEVRDND